MRFGKISFYLPEWFGLLSRILCLFPIWVTTATLTNPIGYTPLWCYGALLFCGSLPAFGSRYCTLSRSRCFRFLLLCIAVGSCFLLCRTQIGTLCSALLSSVTAIYGNTLRRKEPDELFDTHPFISFLTLETVALILLHTVEIAVSMPLTLGITAYQAIVFLLLRNHYHLLRLVNRRSDYALPIPKEIHRANWRLICLLIVGAAILFLLRAPLIAFLELLLASGTALLAWLAKCLISLVHFLGGNAPEAPSASENPEMLPQTYEEGNPLWSLLFLLIIPMVIFIWRVLFSGYFRDLLDALRQRIAKRSDSSRPQQYSSEEEYEDTETICHQTVHTADHDRRRQWKKAYRRWKKLPDTEDKLQKGYHLLMTAPAWGDGAPLPPDTPLEVLQKGQTVLHDDTHLPMEGMTEHYQQTRYGAQPMAPQTIAELEHLLQKLSVKTRTAANRKEHSV